MYSVEIRTGLDKILRKLFKRDRRQYEIIMNKIEEIVQDPHRYKNLRAPLDDWKRVHIDRHFVLTFSIDEDKKIVTLEDFAHHDSIYGKRR